MQYYTMSTNVQQKSKCYDLPPPPQNFTNTSISILKRLCCNVYTCKNKFLINLVYMYNYCFSKFKPASWDKQMKLILLFPQIVEGQHPLRNFADLFSYFIFLELCEIYLLFWFCFFFFGLFSYYLRISLIYN